MIRKTTAATFTTVLFATIFLSTAPSAHAQQCSFAGVAGKWGFTTSGTVVGVGPRVSVGIFTLDGAGNVLRGKATASLNGGVTEETFSGTYTVNSDCTGKLAADILDSSGNKILTIAVNLVFDDNVRQVRAIFTSAVLPNGTPLATVITVDAKKMFASEE